VIKGKKIKARGTTKKGPAWSKEKTKIEKRKEERNAQCCRSTLTQARKLCVIRKTQREPVLERSRSVSLWVLKHIFHVTTEQFSLCQRLSLLRWIQMKEEITLCWVPWNRTGCMIQWQVNLPQIYEYSNSNLLFWAPPQTIDYDKNTEITHDCSLLLVVERILLDHWWPNKLVTYTFGLMKAIL
jgi:hypothetical protein